jgi:hypothetical protein
VPRGLVPAVVGYAEGGRVLLDLRSVPADGDATLVTAVLAAAALVLAPPARPNVLPDLPLPEPGG